MELINGNSEIIKDFFQSMERMLEGIGKLVKVPIKITLANVNITSGRHDRCNQFPFTSSCTVTALACVNSLSNS